MADMRKWIRQLRREQDIDQESSSGVNKVLVKKVDTLRLFCSSALRIFCCCRCSETLTGDTMSGVARDAAAGAAKRRRD